MRKLIGATIGLAIATALVVAWVAFPSYQAVGDPLDQCSAERLKMLHGMWRRAACEENPHQTVIGDIIGRGDLRVIICNANAMLPPPFRVPVTLRAASVLALTVPLRDGNAVYLDQIAGPGNAITETK